MGKVNLGRIHIAANSPIQMKCERPGDFATFAGEIQRKQRAMLYISDYHIQAASKVLRLDPHTIQEGMSRLGCKLWPQNANCPCGGDRLELPCDSKDICTVMLQLSHHLAPLFRLTRPKWSEWLNNDSSEPERTITVPNRFTQPIVDSLLKLFDAADDTASRALEILNVNGFPYPKLEHVLQTAKKIDAQTPHPLLLASVVMKLPTEPTILSFDKSPPKAISSCITDLNLPDSDETLGFWGFRDSGFVLQASKNGQHYVRMKGNRYSLSGKNLRNLLPFIETEMQVKVNPLVESFSNARVWCQTPCKLEPSSINVLRETVSRVSLSTMDRARHGTGHSQEDAFHLRSVDPIRIPDAVTYPSSEQEVEQLVSLAKLMGWCLIPYGGGTNVSNATRCPSEEVEPRPFISVDMKDMASILWINEEDGLAHVQAGITGRALVAEMERRGFTMGHEPDSIEFSTLGGWIATKASGMKRSKYGNIEDIVKSVHAVGTDGLLWKGDKRNNVPGRVSEGLDICSLMLGSEGCLGVITSAVIRVWPLPEIKEFASVLFPAFAQGLHFLRDVSKLGPNIPASVRLLDNEHFRLGQALRPESSFFWSHAQNALLQLVSFWNGPLDKHSVVCATISYEGSYQEVREQKRAMKQLASMYGGISLGSSAGKAGYDLTFMIAYLRDFAMTYHLLGESFESFVPWSKIEALIQATKARILKEHGARHLPGVPFVGCRVTQLYHEGACLYFYFAMSFDGVQNASDAFASIERAARSEILEQGGSISHHHGLGKLKAPFLQGRSSPAYEKAMAAVKKGLDEDNIFGAGNGQFASTVH
jgi:alkyldihydroxyacetonephosphate synthase